MKTNIEFIKTYLQARFADDERGASLVEYALLVALIAVVAIVAIQFLAGNVTETFDETGSSIANSGEG